MNLSSQAPTPEPLPYHRAIVQHLQSEEPGLWKWFASTRKREEAAESVRLDLLKSTYRLETPLHPKLYEPAGELCEHMALPFLGARRGENRAKGGHQLAQPFHSVAHSFAGQVQVQHQTRP